MHDTANPYPNVQSPVGAVDVDGWDLPHVTGHSCASRYWVGSKRVVDIEQRDEGIEVTIDGLQHSDGRVDRYIVVGQVQPDGRTIIDDPITPQQARAWAAALVAAADEIEAAIELEWQR